MQLQKMEELANEVSIADEDMQCGLIYLHEPSKMLKFFCIICEKTYDNINYYCEHLSEHVYGPSESNNENGEPQADGSEEVAAPHNNIHGQELTSYKSEAQEIDETVDSSNVDHMAEIYKMPCPVSANVFKNADDSCSEDFHGYEDDEIDEDEEESRQFLFEQSYNECEDDDDSMHSVEAARSTIPEDAMSNKSQENSLGIVYAEGTDFENLIGNAKILKPSKTIKTPEPPEPRKIKIEPPLQNVKKLQIITMKNQSSSRRLEELYSKIIFPAEFQDEKPTNPTTLTPDNSAEATRKIIGQTVITSLPAEKCVSRLSSRDEVECLACKKVFRNQSSLATHSRTHYLESESSIKVAHKCTDCNELFSRLKDLQAHIQKVHYPHGFKCRLCNKSMRTMPLLEVHMKKMHIHRPYVCRLCGRKNFNCSKDLEEHLLSHGSEETFRCYICGRHYAHEVNLKQHMDRHAKRVPQCCVVCGKITLRLTQHMKIHSPRPTRLLQCPICNKIFSFTSALSRHIKVMHKLPRIGRPKMARKDDNNANAIKRRRKPKPTPTENIIVEEEEESPDQKKVIVELIENVMNRRSLLDEHNAENMDCTVARYETIAAVQSITSPTKRD